MCHDDGANKTGAETPGGGPDILLGVVLIQVLDVKSLGEVLGKEV